MSDLPCMILAAGFGTRMGALTAERPKPLIEVAGKALLDHALDQAAGCAPIVVNGHYRAEQIRQFLTARPGVQFSEERPEILDSGGGIRQALPLLSRPTLASLNADAVWTGPNAIAQLRAAWQPDRMDMLSLLVPLSRSIGRSGGGDFARASDGQLSWDKGSDSALVWTGAQIFKASVLEGYPPGPFSLREVWSAAMERGRFFGTIHQGHWADVGHPEGIALAETMLREARDV